jgi:hypothetical protein
MSIPRHGNNGQCIVGACRGIGAADDGVQMASFLVPSGAARNVGEGAGRQQVALCVIGKGSQEVLLLFWRPVVNHWVQGQPMCQHGRWYVDIDTTEFFSSNRDIEDGEAASPVENGINDLVKPAKAVCR